LSASLSRVELPNLLFSSGEADAETFLLAARQKRRCSTRLPSKAWISWSRTACSSVASDSRTGSATIPNWIMPFQMPS
jgi:hypothetical protein